MKYSSTAMTGPQNPIYPTEPPEFEPVRISPIEGDKRVPEKFSEKEGFDREKKRSLFFLSLMHAIRRSLLQILPKKEGKALSLEEETKLIEHVKEFREIISHLKESDESEKPHFAQHLSDAWHKLLADYEIVQKIEHVGSPLRKAFKHLMNEINAYPPTEEHSLGFYLEHYAGEKWLPFPFMAILQHLHENYMEKTEESDLNHLTNRADDLLNILLPFIPPGE